MKEKGTQRGNSDLRQFLDTPATWVVRARSGAVGNASCLRAALEIAARKTHGNDPLASIASVSRFHNQRLHIYRRQIRKLLKQTGLGPNSSSMPLNPDAPRPTKRKSFSRLGWIFSWRNAGSAWNSSRGEVTTSIDFDALQMSGDRSRIESGAAD